MDPQGAELMVELFSLCRPEVRRVLISRPLAESQCGNAFNPRATDFRRLNVSVIEYALPSSLPSGRETFHAKVVLADTRSFMLDQVTLWGRRWSGRLSVACSSVVRPPSRCARCC